MSYTLNDESLRRLKDWKIKNFRPVFQQFGMSFRQGMAAIFANTGGRVNPNRVVDGITWERLDEKYRRWKANIVPFGTLVFDGTLADSFRKQGAPGNIERIADYRAEYGSSLALARWHQSGTRTIPARPIIYPSRARNKAFKQIMLDYFSAKFKQLGINVELTLENT